MPAIDALIFDLDDTLYPERAFAFSGFTAVAEVFADLLSGADQAAARMRQLFDTEHRPRVFNTLLAEIGLEPDPRLITAMVQAYRTHRPTIALHADADAALTRLRGRCRLGLITDGPIIMQRHKIEALGLRTRLDKIILTAEFGEGFGKPHTRAFETMAERLGTNPALCAYVADNPAKDFAAPNVLGWRTVQIRRVDGIYRNNSPAEGGRPSAVIDTLDLLDGVLNGV